MARHESPEGTELQVSYKISLWKAGQWRCERDRYVSVKFPFKSLRLWAVRIAVVVFQYRYQTLTDHLLESKSVFDSLPYCCRRFDLLVVYGDLTSIIKSSSSSFLIPTRYTLFKLYLHSTFSSGKSRSKCNAEVATQESLQCALD